MTIFKFRHNILIYYSKNPNNILTMKKLISILIGFLFSYISFSQIERSTPTQQRSNYEIYVINKDKGISQNTIDPQKKEWDDLYYIPSRDELKRKAKNINLRKKGIRIEHDSLYYDAKKEVYEDLSFTAQIYRFHRPYYGFGYYNYYWDPFCNLTFLKSWYYGYYPYWGFRFDYNNWYSWGYTYDSYYPNCYFGRNTYYSHYYNSKIQYGRREKPSNLSSSFNTNIKRQPSKIDRTPIRPSAIQENRRVNNLQKINSSNERRVTTNRSNYNPARNNQIRSYTPNYSQPHSRSQYNNTNINRSYSPVEHRSYSTPSGNYNSGSSYSGGSSGSRSGGASGRSGSSRTTSRRN